MFEQDYDERILVRHPNSIMGTMKLRPRTVSRTRLVRQRLVALQRS